jgi:quercetin dioxygenase-like cupin family protein
MLRKANVRGYRPALAGIDRKTLAYGALTLLTEFRMRRGSVLPRHAHPHEQTGYLVSGRMKLTVGRNTIDARPGDSWSIPGSVQHGAQILEDTVAIEVFSPVRQDYLPSPRTRSASNGPEKKKPVARKARPGQRGRER